MAREWKSVALDQLYEFSSGLSKPRSAFGSGHPFLAFKDIFYNSSVPAQLNELVNSTEQERSQCSIRRGDVFLTRTSETMDELGMSCVALRDVPNATFNGLQTPRRTFLRIPGLTRVSTRIHMVHVHTAPDARLSSVAGSPRRPVRPAAHRRAIAPRGGRRNRSLMSVLTA